MRIAVLLFGPEAAALGQNRVEVETAASPTAADVRELLAAGFPALRAHLPAARLAINHEFAAPDRRIAPGDEIALIGLVSGG
jgi:molybdopterin synthase catalytic subunit